ncbi:uncharacterized protein LOC141629519 [Silene latifolia]|uniref:uncharacterized protein LOC141629519 n=1 Tax=Silene latifolia TaxID=37657 RepID=UPI003D781905
MKEGDINSAYFHGILKKRRNGNKVIFIEDMKGKMCDSPELVQTAFLDYYMQLLGTNQTTTKIHRKIIDQGQRCRDEHRPILLRPVTGEEIRAAVFSIPDNKSPGPDGYTSKFFKDAWNEIGGEVINVVQDFFRTRQLLKQVNATNVTLIPKCDRPQTVYQFRPIACCNVVYKVISKLLCAILTEVLPLIIDPNQGAFIQNRSIQENILICQDLIRCYEKPNVSPRCLFKIDLQKAYDTVEWSFVEKLLEELRFPVEFQEMLMQCITISSLVFLIPQWGNVWIFPWQERGVPDQLKHDILSVSGFIEGKLPFKYFGMPIQTTRLQKQDCECLVEKICSRIHGYGAKKFSYAGRLVLVKAVLTTLHSYWASLFVLPKGIIAKVEAVCRNFLWDNCADYHRVPLMAWETVCKPKAKGGLGIKNLEMMNKALIGKLVNWIAEDKDIIWVKWVKHNHLKGVNWWQYQPGANTSWVWRRVCRVKQDLVAAYTNGAWDIQGVGFTTASCYQWLMGSRPKASEDLDHLFFGCDYSLRIVQHLQQNTGLNLPVGNVLDWCLQDTGTKMKRGVKAGMIVGAIYHVWHHRNKCRNEGVLLRPQKVATNIVDDMKLRVHGKDRRKLTILELDWLKGVGLM